MSGKKPNVFKRIFDFYYEGFKNMPSWGIKAWALILIKLFIMFAILRLFFFPNIMSENFDNDKERADYMIEELTKPISYD
ncbi:MAG: DUF4492 domain-containing protein [Bacteroidales bacterium]|nr:DUF4492 domain-containing protein [Bacteroidales bacterium]MCF8328587.1 DUF4492 domain-containing protein [Bacteroidales bacterium]